jgi:transcriptional regulator with XRE-family HTH domain
MSVAAKTRAKDKFTEFISDNERRRIYERESLAFDAAELISKLMEEQNVSKAELARRIGKSRSDITQLLNGSRNLTLHTLADLAFALGTRFELKARSCLYEHQQVASEQEAKSLYLYRFAKPCPRTYVSSDEHTEGQGSIRFTNVGA